MSQRPQNQTGPSISNPASKGLGTTPREAKQDQGDQQKRQNQATLTGGPQRPAEIAPGKNPITSEAPAVKPLAQVASSWPASVQPKEQPKPSPIPQPSKSSPGAQPQAKPRTPASPDGGTSLKSAPATAPTQPANQIAAPAGRKLVKITFVRAGCQSVSLCGDFNGWSPISTPLNQKEGGRWETLLTLAPGRYQYKFVVDGQWLHDPAAKTNVPNPHGSLNSVLEV